jgi:hypothetical protein
MDELEVAFTHALAPKTDCNHIFLNFVPKVTMDPTKVPYVRYVVRNRTIGYLVFIFVLFLSSFIYSFLILTSLLTF